MAAGEVVLLAPAKLNLALKVAGRRADGYHELDAPTVPLDWADTLIARPRTDGRIVSKLSAAAGARLGPLPSAASELAARAAAALAAAAGTRLGVELAIAKRIPLGAGLGGGSSDAAAALLACNRLWGLRWPLARLGALAATLGADVPFFVRCRQARLRGAGETLQRLGRPVGGYALVVVPAVRVSTAAVFARLARAGPARAAKGIKSPACSPCNDLEEFAITECPAIGRVLGAMRSMLGAAQLSGSGGACFATFASRAAASAAAAKLAVAELDASFVVARIMRMRPRRLGSGQVVRQRILAPSCVGSNPTSPA